MRGSTYMQIALNYKRQHLYKLRRLEYIRYLPPLCFYHKNRNRVLNNPNKCERIHTHKKYVYNLSIQ